MCLFFDVDVHVHVSCEFVCFEMLWWEVSRYLLSFLEGRLVGWGVRLQVQHVLTWGGICFWNLPTGEATVSTKIRRSLSFGGKGQICFRHSSSSTRVYRDKAGEPSRFRYGRILVGVKGFQQTTAPTGGSSWNLPLHRSSVIFCPVRARVLETSLQHFILESIPLIIWTLEFKST